MPEEPEPQHVLTHRPDPDADPATLVYTFGGAEPVATVEPGTTLEVWTEDCFAGRVRLVSDRVSQVCDPRYLNPQTGPFHIAGAEPGDTLAVHFVSIEPSRDWAVSTTVPLFGSLTSHPDHCNIAGSPAGAHLGLRGRPSEARADVCRPGQRPPRHDATRPHAHGTVGVAPALGEVLSALTPGAHGANMDTPELRAGVTCYLGVNVPGAAFSLGDGHCRQGEGETCGVAVEAAMDTVVIVDVIKAWEGACRSQDPAAMSTWWTHHADPHLNTLLNGESGPMWRCSPTQHRNVPYLPVVTAPQGWFDPALPAGV